MIQVQVLSANYHVARERGYEVYGEWEGYQLPQYAKEMIQDLRKDEYYRNVRIATSKCSTYIKSAV